MGSGGGGINVPDTLPTTHYQCVGLPSTFPVRDSPQVGGSWSDDTGPHPHDPLDRRGLSVDTAEGDVSVVFRCRQVRFLAVGAERGG